MGKPRRGLESAGARTGPGVAQDADDGRVLVGLLVLDRPGEEAGGRHAALDVDVVLDAAGGEGEG